MIDAVLWSVIIKESSKEQSDKGKESAEENSSIIWLSHTHLKSNSHWFQADYPRIKFPPFSD